MKFSIKNAELSAKLALVARTIATGGGTPALGGILVTAEEGRLSFSSTNGNLSLKVPVHLEGAIEGEGKVLLPGRLFSDISRLLGSGEAQFEYRQSERDVEIKSGSSNFHIRTLAGDDFPSFEDTEASFDELKVRVSRTIAYIEGLAPSAIDGSEEREIALTRRGETTIHRGEDYLLRQALPNFYFHVVTAYDILRHNGVPVGKRDYLGPA